MAGAFGSKRPGVHPIPPEPGRGKPTPSARPNRPGRGGSKGAARRTSASPEQQGGPPRAPGAQSRRGSPQSHIGDPGGRGTGGMAAGKAGVRQGQLSGCPESWRPSSRRRSEGLPHSLSEPQRACRHERPKDPPRGPTWPDTGTDGPVWPWAVPADRGGTSSARGAGDGCSALRLREVPTGVDPSPSSRHHRLTEQKRTPLKRRAGSGNDGLPPWVAHPGRVADPGGSGNRICGHGHGRCPTAHVVSRQTAS